MQVFYPYYISTLLKEHSYVILSYFNHRQNENKTLQRQKNAKEIIIKHKETRMVKDGED